MTVTPASPAELRERVKKHQQLAREHRKIAKRLAARANELESATGVKVRLIPSEPPKEAESARDRY